MYADNFQDFLRTIQTYRRNSEQASKMKKWVWDKLQNLNPFI